MNLIHVRFHHNLLLLFNMFSTFFLVVGIWLLVSKSTDGFHMRTIKTKSATINLSGRLKSLQMSTLNLGTSSSSGTSISTALEIIREKLDAPPETILTTVEKAANYRLSASEASIQTGASISESRRGLMTLATLTGGDLEVTPDGDIIYSYPLNFRRILSQRSLGQKIREFKKKVYPVLYKLIRLSVSAMLFTSLAIVSTTIILAMSSSSKDSDDDSSSSRRSRSRSSSIHINLFDFSTRTSNASYKDQSGEENKIGFFNSFFSFVFGDGNPNQEFSSTQFQKTAQLIRNCNGIITAEEMATIFDAPYDPPSVSTDGFSSVVVSESWVLPALIQFGGEPVVGEDGNIYYKFEELLQTTSNPKDKQLTVTKRVVDTPLESNIPFSRAEPTFLSLAAVLGFLNLIGVVILDGIIKTPALLAQSKYILWVSKIYPLLVAYAGAYTAIPIIRSLKLIGENRDIKIRNARRQQWLNHCASQQLQSKFSKACELAVGMAEKRKAQLQSLTDLNVQSFSTNINQLE